MNLYDVFMSFFEKGDLGSVRKELLYRAYGRVLEIGVGTGVNLPYYKCDNIESIMLTDIKESPVLTDKLGKKMRFALGDIHSLDFPDESFDTIVITLVFCSVKDVDKGLHEVLRLLKPDGQILFIEHVRPEIKPFDLLADRVTPLWKKVASNCHLNRDFLQSLEDNNIGYELLKKFNKTAFVAGSAYKNSHRS